MSETREENTREMKKMKVEHTPSTTNSLCSTSSLLTSITTATSSTSAFNASSASNAVSTNSESIIPPIPSPVSFRLLYSDEEHGEWDTEEEDLVLLKWKRKIMTQLLNCKLAIDKVRNPKNRSENDCLVYAAYWKQQFETLLLPVPIPEKYKHQHTQGLYF